MVMIFYQMFANMYVPLFDFGTTCTYHFFNQSFTQLKIIWLTPFGNGMQLVHIMRSLQRDHVKDNTESKIFGALQDAQSLEEAVSKQAAIMENPEVQAHTY